MGLPLLKASPTSTLVHERTLALVRHESGAEFYRTAFVSYAVDLAIAKKGSEHGKVYSDGDGSYRWITVHPNGDDSKGVPVKVRESKTERGVWHVVGGAGGNLNYLKLHLGTVEEQKARAQAKLEAKKLRAKNQRELERERKAGLSEEERKAEAEDAREQKRQQAAARDELRTRQQEQIAAVAQHLGWKEDEWKFDATRERLKASGASAERIQQQEEAHTKRVYQRVQDALAQTKRTLLADRERAAGRIPLTSEDGETVALTDLLDGPKTPKGKGYKSVTKESSDAEIRAALAATDATALAAELHAAEASLGDPTANPEAAAHVADLRAQIHTAELIAKAETMTEGEIEQRRVAVSEALAAAQTSQDGYRPRLTALREKLRATDGKGLDLAETAELESLELQQAEDLRHVQRLKAETVDLAVMAGETIKPAVAGEQRKLSAANQAAREAAIRQEHGESGVESYRALREKLRAGTAKYQAEMEHYRATGALRRPELTAKPIADADAALQLLAKQKALTKMERQLAGKPDDLDLRMFGKGYFDAVGKASPEMIAEVEKDFENTIREQKTRAFLARADSPELLLGRGGAFSDQHDSRTLHQALERHLSAGAYNALNNAALAGVKAPVLSRDVVDTLGAVGAAQLLAHTMAQHETPATLRAMAKGLGEYHVQANVDQAEERLREVEEALDQADEAIGHLTSPDDVAVALEANQRRQAKLEEARQTLGQALGEYEATAALVKALGSKPPTEIQTNLGPVGTETAIRQLRALGLDREDYSITSDGTNYFATVKASGFAKLAAPVDPAQIALQDEVMAIKRGERDEPGWRPPGTVLREATTFTAPGLEPAPLRVTPLGDALRESGQGGLFGGGGGSVDVADAVRTHLARRAANGEDPNTLLADLHGSMLAIPAEHREAVAAEINRVFPLMQPLVEKGKPVYRTGADGKALLGEDGKPIPKMVPTKAETHAAALRQLTRDVFAKEGLDRSADLHSQTIDLAHPKTREALTRALAEDPRGLVAFKAPGELTTQDQRVLRHAFATNVAKQDDPATGLDTKALEAKLAELGPEPAPQKDLFSGTETPTEEGLEWRRQRDAIVAEAQQGNDGNRTTSWNDYVAVMGGTRNAYQAMQDHLRSGLLKRFHQAYTVLHNQPLRVGTRSIAHAERHAGYVDPAKRAQLLADRAKLLDEARNRVAGQYAAGSVTEKMGRLAQADEIARQNQMGLLGATPAATTKKAPDAHERYTLGETVEGQLASLMPSMARAFDPSKPVPLLKDVSWQGAQERFIKLGLASKRIAGAMGVGSGKSGAAIGLLTAARADPTRNVQRGLYLVPSAVQGQFGAEFARFVEPGALTWSANTGASRAERLAEHADADTHAVVHTHEAARDDFLHMLGQHWNLEPDAARDKLMGLDRKGAAAELKAAMAKAGVRYDMLVTDEAHKLLDRECVAGETRLQLANGTSMTFAELHKSGERPIVLAWNGSRLVPVRATAVFTKGESPMFEVRLSNGAAIRATKAHRFLTVDGWQHLSELSVGDTIASSGDWPGAFALGLPWSMGLDDPTAPLGGGPHSTRTAPDTRGGYQPYSARARYDGRPPSGEEIDRACAPSQDDVRRRAHAHPHGDDQGSTAARTHEGRSTDHPSIQGDDRRGAAHCDAWSDAPAVASGSWLPSSRESSRSHPTLHQPGIGAQSLPCRAASDDHRRATRSAAPSTQARGAEIEPDRCSPESAVLSAERSRRRDEGDAARESGSAVFGRSAACVILAIVPCGSRLVYDIGVPGLHNYLAESVINHNSKPDSVLSRVVQALSDITPYYASMSADPIKNDVSELRSLLDKLHPDGRYGDAGAWQRRYGVNTTAAAEALKREIAPSVYAASVPTGNQVTRRRTVVPMHPKQTERYGAVMGAFEKLRSARARGIVDVESAKLLAPERFEKAPDTEHQAIAREIQRNPGALKEQALRRIVDEAPREENAKIQELVRQLKDHPVRDKPAVIFASRLKAVHEITEALAEQGHRVQSLTGADSADVRDEKRRRFQDEKSVDVFVLSDAGEAGLNLQRGSKLYNYDTPMTAKTFEQRNGRIDRRGREDPEVELEHLATDSPFEARAHARLQTKGELRQILTDPAELLDDTGVAKVFSDARRRAVAEAAGRAA